MVVYFVLLWALVLAYTQKFIYKKFWDKNLFYDFSFESSAVFEGESTNILEKVANKKLLPLSFIVSKYRLDTSVKFIDKNGKVVFEGSERNSLTVLRINKTILKKSNILCTKRGYYMVDTTAISSNNVLFSKFYSKDVDVNKAITVYPKIIETENMSILFKKIHGEIITKRLINPDPFEFKGIREYQPYDSYKQVNFNASAKTGVLMSNIYNFTSSGQVRILLNLEAFTSYRRDMVYETAIRIAASLSKEFLLENISVSLIISNTYNSEPAIVNVESGTSINHLYEILDALAKASYNGDMYEFTSIFNDLIDYDSINILISPCFNDELFTIYEENKNKDKSIFIIIPKLKNDEFYIPVDENILTWEVTNDH